MRKKKLSTVLVPGVLLVAAVASAVALLTGGRPVPASGAFQAGQPAAARQVVATTTTLSTSMPSPAPQGTALQLTATVTPAAATGTVQFRDGSANIGNPVIASNGTASISTSTLAVGPHELTAVFRPDNPAAYGPSTSPTVMYTIAGASPTSTVLSTSAASPVPQGTSVTLTATLTPSAAVGMVQFKDGSANIGDPVAVSNGTASTATTTLAVGTRPLTAVFMPTNPMLYGPSTSPVVPFTISGATTTSTTLNASSTATPAVVGSTVTLTATVNPAAAAGTVQFRDGATNIGDAVTVSNGNASTTTTTLAAGSRQLGAVFTPTDTNLYSGSTSPTVTFVISGATATSNTLTTSPARRVVEGTPVTLTATVAPSAAAGTVQFRDGNTNVGAPVTVNNGTASRASTFGVGPHQLTAVFTPTNTALYSGSTSPSVTFTVDARPLLGAAAAIVPDRQDPPGDRGPQPRRPRIPLSGLDDHADTSTPIAGALVLMVTLRWRKARVR